MRRGEIVGLDVGDGEDGLGGAGGWRRTPDHEERDGDGPASTPHGRDGIGAPAADREPA